MVELCDNGIDDDMDGLTDYEDDDCVCLPDWSYYITNWHFEDTLRCPCIDLSGTCIGLAAATDAAVGWLDDDSWNGADYWNECFDFNLPGVAHEIPLPVPNGMGVMGFRANGPINKPPNKEYIAQCLPNSLAQGEDFKISFDIGFPDNVPDSVFVSIFGTADCNNWPLPYNTANGGEDKPCPSNFPGWVELGMVLVRKSDSGAWTRAEIDFIPSMDIRAIAIGGSCTNYPFQALGDYYFINDLQLTKAELCDIVLQISDPDCPGRAILRIEDEPPNASYQWYKDSIALPGETSATYTIPRTMPNGNYQLQVAVPEGCFMSRAFEYFYSDPISYDTVTICEGSSYMFGTSLLQLSGNYIDTFANRQNCDSIVHLRLDVLPAQRIENQISICEGGSYAIGSNTYQNSGSYFDTLTTIGGCDSIVNTLLTVLPQRHTALNETICQNEFFVVGNSRYNSSGTYTDSLKAANGCDSIVTLTLRVQEVFDTTIQLVLCPGDQFVFGDLVLSEPGEYSQYYLNQFGCDSNVVYSVQEAIDPISLDDQYIIELGNTAYIDPLVLYEYVDSIRWLPNDNILFDPEQIDQSIQPLSSTLFVLEAIDHNACIWRDTARIVLRATRRVFIPNAFTPNGDGTNDSFFPYVRSDVQKIIVFRVFDRWGNIVYQDFNIDPGEFEGGNRGWDGSIGGGLAPQGVYTYAAKIRFIDGVEKLYKGDVTLLRTD